MEASRHPARARGGRPAPRHQRLPRTALAEDGRWPAGRRRCRARFVPSGGGEISGFGYSWDPSAPEDGERVIEVHDSNGPIALDASYSVAANNFIAAGGDNFTVLTSATDQVGGPVDLDALIDYLKALPQPFSASIDGRISQP